MKNPLTRTLLVGLVAMIIIVILTRENTDGRRGFWIAFIAILWAASIAVVIRRSKEKK